MSNYTVHDGDDRLQQRHSIELRPVFPRDHAYRLACETPFQKRNCMSPASSSLSSALTPTPTG